MTILTQEQFDKVIKVVGNKNYKWICSRSYGTLGNIPAGWSSKNEPFELVSIAKKLFEENKELKLKIEQLQGNTKCQ